MADTRKPFHETVAERLIEQLRQGTAPWQQPWAPGAPGLVLPTNPTTGKRYKGINAVYLMCQGRSDQRWMTYKQAAAAGGQVRKGETGTPIQYWKFSDERIKTDDNGQAVRDANGKPVMETVQLERPKVFFAAVFNAEQIDGLPALHRAAQSWNAVERAERILSNSGATIRHADQNRAYYAPSTDSIHLPNRVQFPTADSYYAVALHELGHWSGHSSRLDRDLTHPFGSEGYAREELRAEIASMILGDELGIGHDPSLHASYVASWIKALQDDPLEIFRAAADAEKIQGFVLCLEQALTQQHDHALGDLAEAITSAQETVRTPGGPAQVHLSGKLLTMKEADVRERDDTNRPVAIPTVETAFKLNPPDALVANTRLELITAETSTLPAAGVAFDNAAELALGFRLPHDWNGRVQVQGNISREIDGAECVQPAEALGVAAEFWGVYAQLDDGTHRWLADLATLQQAEVLAERLSLIDAMSERNPYEKAARLARVHEERVRRDPTSTDDDVAAAKEARKSAELTAMRSDRDLPRRSAELDRDQKMSAELPASMRQPGLADPVKTAQPHRHYITVPFREKEEAKTLGARWDRQEQCWYFADGADPATFDKWPSRNAGSRGLERTDNADSKDGRAARSATEDRRYLAVPYGEHSAAKAAGARWDKVAKSWYAGPKADSAKLERWTVDRVRDRQPPVYTPQEEFADALRSLGCVVDGAHPIMDGKTHRIAVLDDRKGEHAGFYVGHLDGLPAGYIKNNRTGVEITWNGKGYTLDPAERARLHVEAAEKSRAREAEQARLHEAVANRIRKRSARLVPVAEPTPYMRTKGIAPQTGALTDKESRTTYVPAIDADGKLWTMQYIREDGTKRFAKNSRKDGCFHVVGGIDALTAAPALVIGEGFATASSLAQSLGFATIAAFDAGNLPSVALALHEKYPDKPIVIAGDDDRHLETTQGVNPGRTKAQEAAKRTGGTVVLPIFTPSEHAADPKGHTDFNDLANRCSMGRERLERQIGSIVESVLETSQTLGEPRSFELKSERNARGSVRLVERHR